MNEYYVKVNFVKGQILTNLKKLVQNDYNTAKLNFTFDKEGRVLFKMLYPDGTQYVDEIQNNELVFGKGVLNQEGTYEYEISLYSEDGRLTDYAVKSFEVRSELVDTDEIVEPDDRVPVLDNLINEVSTIKQDVEDGKYNGKDGIDGKDGITPAIGENGNWFIDGVDTGMSSQGTEGPQGPAGGLSLEEVETITGKLENLSTEDKSNIVNAINEVMNSGGSEVELLPDYDDTLSSAEKIAFMQKAIDIMKEGKVVLIPVQSVSRFSGSGYDTYLFVSPKLGASDDLNTMSGGTVAFKTQWWYQPYENSFDNYSIQAIPTWKEIVVKVTNGVVTTVNNISRQNHNNNSDKITISVLGKKNTTAYTPTGDYNPATKKYVDDITGDLTTLGTEDKSNLVNAINEVMASGGSDLPVEFISSNYRMSGSDAIFTTASSRTELVEKVLKVTANGTREGMITFFGESQERTDLVFKSYNNANGKYGWNFIGFIVGNWQGVTSLPKIYKVKGSLFTTTNFEFSSFQRTSEELDLTKFLSKTNTTAYTPTSYYHPATKKYVDDSIASAISSALGDIESLLGGI